MAGVNGARARQLIEPVRGEIVAEFFDIGQSRSLPWPRRPEAARLLAALPNPDRPFGAVVLGEPQRAFYGNQFGLTFPVFVHYDVELWVPEVGGAIDPGSDAHEIVMSLYGGMSKGERNRIKTRVRAAMASQAAIEGRLLGGRPPYGYTLANGQPHPNPSKAAGGLTLKHLEPNPETSPVVRRIFGEFLSGKGLQAIARDLSADGVPSPSASDPGRNSHRIANGPSWHHTAVRAILDNPRYTGHQVWNRQRRQESLIDVNDVALGHETRMKWNDRDDWVWSTEPSHQGLVTRDLWEAAQTRLEANRRIATRRPKTGRRYLLAGRIRCGSCGRRMEGSWNHDNPYYRCQIHRGDPNDPKNHPSTIYVKEEILLPGLDGWLAELFDPTHFEDTCQALTKAAPPEPEDESRKEEIRQRIADLDRELDGYRTILRIEPDAAATVGRWIAEATQQRRRLQTSLRDNTSTRLSKGEIEALVASLRDIANTLARADPDDKAGIYEAMGIEVTYHQDGQVLMESRPRVVNDGVGGPTHHLTTRPPLTKTYLFAA